MVVTVCISFFDVLWVLVMDRLSSLPKSQNLMVAKCVYVQKMMISLVTVCVVESALSVYARDPWVLLPSPDIGLVYRLCTVKRGLFNAVGSTLILVSFLALKENFFDPAFRVLSAPIHQIYRL